MDLRAAAREIFFEALGRVDLKVVLRRKLQIIENRLVIGSASYSLSDFEKVSIIAIGKAALPMTEVLLEKLDPLLGPTQSLQGIVVDSAPRQLLDPRFLCRLGSHPLPDRESLESARLILRLLQESTERTLVFFLISGGASAMVELPLEDSIGLQTLIDFYQALVLSGLPIRAMNTLRKHMSAVKGGRLALAAGEATQCTLLVSDVPPGQDDVIGAGPSMPDTSTVGECRSLLSNGLFYAGLPSVVRALLLSENLLETPKPGHAAFRHATFHTVLSSMDLCEAAQVAAEARGFTTETDLTCDEWEYQAAANHLLERLNAGPGELPVCVISAGELSVPIRGVAGMGGRNQQFALYCARTLSDWSTRAAVLSVGSDGIDGNSPAAGAVVDQTTWQRATDRGLSGDDALSAFDAYPLLSTIGDTVMTGPSGNNLRDLRILLRTPSR